MKYRDAITFVEENFTQSEWSMTMELSLKRNFYVPGYTIFTQGLSNNLLQFKVLYETHMEILVIPASDIKRFKECPRLHSLED
jgi:hypothetical protein